MILVLAGTAEGRQTVQALRDEGFKVIASVISSYGSHLLESQGVLINKGPLDKNGLYGILSEKNISIIVDATHPFAHQISLLAMEAARELNLKYIRLERKNSVLPESPLIKRIERLEEIERYITRGKVVFSTLGSKNLPLIVPIINKAGAELIARVLPCSDSINTCEKLGLNPANIVALKGPFPKYINKSLFMYYGAQLVLTKESGDIGGFKEKVEAALELDIPVVVLSRPQINYPLMVHTAGEVVEYVTKQL